MPSLEWNTKIWRESFDWQKGGGDEWSEPWGSTYAQWITTLYPRISAFLPAGKLLEIAPGFGRWASFLIPMCENYMGIDLSEKCVENCKESFAGNNNVTFFQNDGISLAACADNTVDFCFSFDSLIHVDIDVISKYIEQIVKKLKIDGVAYIHHSNVAEVIASGREVNPAACKDETVDCEKVYNLIETAGGKVLLQEKFPWLQETELTDGITVFCRADSPKYKNTNYQLIVNRDSESEMLYSKLVINKYCNLTEPDLNLYRAGEADEILLKILTEAEENSVYLYGTGHHTNYLLTYYLPNKFRSKVKGIISNESSEMGTVIQDYPVCDISGVEEGDTIIVSSKVFQDVIYDRIKHLEVSGIRIEKLY